MLLNYRICRNNITCLVYLHDSIIFFSFLSHSHVPLKIPFHLFLVSYLRFNYLFLPV
jgi:hypothetical protein